MVNVGLGEDWLLFEGLLELLLLLDVVLIVLFQFKVGAIEVTEVVSVFQVLFVFDAVARNLNNGSVFVLYVLVA